MRRRAALAAFALVWLATSAAAADKALNDAGKAPDLIGTWHVLIHYTNANTANPDVTRWDDKVWVFEKQGSRLRWSEYPIVVFGDQSGRFEAFGSNPRSRVLAGWEPNAGQLAQIRGGLEVNPRGKKSKSLRDFGDEGWRSTSRATAASASVVSYVEYWSIGGTPALPIFRREDSLGGGRTDTLDGVTLYTSTEVEPSGNVIRGRFERDGTRVGTFRLLRSGDVSNVKGSGQTPNARVRDEFVRDLLREGAEGASGDE